MIADKLLPPEASTLSIFPSELGAPTFYLLPKIHKMRTPTDIPPGRPIVSACSCPTERISAFLDMILQPYVKLLPTYVKDTNHALTLFDQYTFSDSNPRILFTMDVSSLYTSIPHADGLRALRHFLDSNPSPHITSDTVIRLAELVLTMNSFEFDGEFYQQISGVAMGTKMGPCYACLFMGYLEQQIFDSFPGTIPDIFLRYIDDIVGVTSMSYNELQNFFLFANNFHPNIKFTTTTSSTQVTFLDINLFLSPFCLSTSVHYKETDSHSYLRYSSSHPKSCKDSIPFSQFLRLRRLCSEDYTFEQEASRMITFFRTRGYPTTLLNRAYSKVRSISRARSLRPRSGNPHRDASSSRPKLIVTYHPHLKPLLDNITSSFQLLQQDPETSPFFPNPPLIVYRRNRNIRDILVHSRLPRAPPPTSIGTFPCSRNCLTCPHVDSAPTKHFPRGHWTLRKTYSCESYNIIYGIECRVCKKFYIGRTGRRLSDRFAEHLSNIRNHKDCPVARHFNSHPHTPSDISVFVLRHCANLLARTLTERRMILQLGTLQPQGINSSLYL